MTDTHDTKQIADTVTWRKTIADIDPEQYLRFLDEKRVARLATYKNAQAEKVRRDKLTADKLNTSILTKAAQVEKFLEQLDKKIAQTQGKIIQIMEERRQLLEITELMEELQAEAKEQNNGGTQ